MTTTALNTSAPLTSCAGASDSPNAAAARTTVTTGSSVDKIDAADGPTRAMPAKKQRIAPTVLTAAIAPTASQPSAPKSNSGPPRTIEASAKVTVAPTHTSPDSATGGTPAPTRAPV